MSESDSLERLLRRLGDRGITCSRDALTLQAYSQDLWPRRHLELRESGPAAATVDCVAWPESAAQVAEIAKLGTEFDAAFYPYGAGSGVCGATIPADGEPRLRVLVDLKKMRKIVAIDSVSMTVRAEAGVIGENLERHLNQEGFTLGHFPSSVYCSSLGGYLATRSAGQLSTKYGKIEDMVLSMEIVLPSGEILEAGRAPRSAMGPDWTQLFLGSEGTLGFFTVATLQISKMPARRELMGFGARDVAHALRFTREIVQRGLRPAVLRIYDPIETTLFLPSEPLKESGFTGKCAIVAVFEGAEGLTQAEAAEAKHIARELEVQDLGPRLGEYWWEHRYDVSYNQQLILSHDRMILDTFEVAATWDKIEEVYRSVKAVSVGVGVVLGHFSHFYHTGANIYFTLVSHAGSAKSATEPYDRIWRDFMAAALGAGATLSHHHGSGRLKNEWIRKEKAGWIDLFRKVKQALDPENRFNPDKMGL